MTSVANINSELYPLQNGEISISPKDSGGSTHFQSRFSSVIPQDVKLLANHELGKLGAEGPGGLPDPEQIQQRMNLLAREISDHGYFKSKGEADWLYQNNTDPNLRVEVDASKLTVGVSQGSGWYDDKELGGQSAWGEVGGGSAFNTDFLVHGSVKINNGDGSLKILPEQYNFEMKPWSTHLMRNLKTLAAEPGPVGTPYWINYRGTPNVQ